MNAACRAEDQQQQQVRHFRSMLYGAATALFVSAVVLWIVGSIHPA
jgi:Na+/H+ antiporter NhaC